MNKVNELLNQITKIKSKHDNKTGATGDNYNIFTVMNMERSEVNTHSSIIGDLLNPNGTHGQGRIFLDLFIEEIRNSFGSDIELDDFGPLVRDKICERTITKEINWENVSGGRIDLIIEDYRSLLIIENKLDAIDQEYQLIRYNNYAETKNDKKNTLLYLTLDGKNLEHEKPYTSEGGLYIEGQNFNYKNREAYENTLRKGNFFKCLYFPISYKIHIRDWITRCIEKTDNSPFLQTILKQYLALIKKITFQTISEEMKEDIVNTILNDSNETTENIESAFAISGTIWNLKKRLYNDLINNLKNNNEGFDIVETDHKDYYGVDVLFENKIRVLFGKRKDKDYCDSVSCGYQINGEILQSNIDKYLASGFEIHNGWIYKWIKNATWGDSPDIWADVSKGKTGETYKEIISSINEIIEIEKS
ncbi:PDDEXK-like family protein [Flavobacterium sp. WC2509]|uniref:PDDEXK-like family protein n=1 Tax=Flavobacterium sp. WC2509 TaxID=3461406 RepID=UPI004043F063